MKLHPFFCSLAEKMHNSNPFGDAYQLALYAFSWGRTWYIMSCYDHWWWAATCLSCPYSCSGRCETLVGYLAGFSMGPGGGEGGRIGWGASRQPEAATLPMMLVRGVNPGKLQRWWKGEWSPEDSDEAVEIWDAKNLTEAKSSSCMLRSFLFNFPVLIQFIQYTLNSWYNLKEPAMPRLENWHFAYNILTWWFFISDTEFTQSQCPFVIDLLYFTKFWDRRVGICQYSAFLCCWDVHYSKQCVDEN